MPILFIADRDTAYRNALGQALNQRGIEVEGFASGAELYARAVTEDPDLIVMDSDLDEMDGFQVFARLQRSRPDKPFPVVFVSEFDHPRVARVCKQRGALGYMGKKHSVEQVANYLESFLTHRDPLQDRKLPGAVAWLQSRGKSGRLEVDAEGSQGYILLHNGAILDARWQSFQGEEAVKALTEELPEASFRFAEGADETDVAPPHEVAPVAESAETSGVPTAATLVDAEDGPAGNGSQRTSERIKPELWDVLLQGEEPTAVEPGGAVAAARELRLRKLEEETRGARLRARRRTLSRAAVGAALVLLVLTGAAVLFPGALPSGLGNMWGGGEGESSDADVEEPVGELAGLAGGRAPEGPVLGAAEGQADDAGVRIDLDAAADQTTEGATVTGAQGQDQTAVSDDEADTSADAGDPAFTGDLATLQTVEPQAEESSREAAAREEQRREEQRREEQRREEQRREEKRREQQRREEIAAARAKEERERATAPPPPPAPHIVTNAPEPMPENPPAQAEQAPDVSGGGDVGLAAPDVNQPSGVESRGLSRGRDRSPSTGIVQKPVLVQRGRDPYYPPELEAQGIGGSVVLNILVGVNGRAQRIEVLRSSGHEAFDQSAVAAVGTFLWEPGRDATGPTETWTSQAVTFRP